MTTPGQRNGPAESKPRPSDELPEHLRALLSPEALAVLDDPNNPQHGEAGHVCVAEVASGLSVEDLVKLAMDGAPMEVILATPDRRAELVKIMADGVLRDVESELINAGHLTPGDSASHEQIVAYINKCSLAFGKAPDLLLTALGVSSWELDPAVTARHEQHSQAKMAMVKAAFPIFFPATENDDVLAELAKDCLPDGMVMLNGLPIPAGEAERLQKEAAETIDSGPWDADNPLNVSLGAEPFILIRVGHVEGMPHLGNLKVNLGGGAEEGYKALHFVSKALEDLTARYVETHRNCGTHGHETESE